MVEKKFITEIDEIKSIRIDSDSREINLNKCPGEPWHVYVSDNTMLTKLKKLMKRAPEGSVKCWVAGTNTAGIPTGYFFELDAKCIAFRAPKSKSKKIISDAEREAKRKAFVERTKRSRLEKKLKSDN